MMVIDPNRSYIIPCTVVGRARDSNFPYSKPTEVDYVAIAVAFVHR